MNKKKKTISTADEEIMRRARMMITKAMMVKPNEDEGGCQHTFWTTEEQTHVSLQTAPLQLLYPQHVFSLL
jgi:hypothetical protein